MRRRDGSIRGGVRRRGRSRGSRALRTRGGKRHSRYHPPGDSRRDGVEAAEGRIRGVGRRAAAAAPCAGEGAYERVVRELLCADPSTNDDDDDDRVGDDDDRYDDRYDDDDDAFARTSYAFEFASLFDGRHLAARTVAALRAR